MGEFGDCSDEIEELCRSELKKCLRVPEEQAPLKGLDLTYTGHPMKILETSERVTRNRKNKACRMQWSDHTEKMSRGRPILISLLASPESRDEIPVRG
jgi:hypothetical protein